MAQTPLEARSLGAADPYLAAWVDLNGRIRRGEPWSGDERNAAFLSLRDRDGRLEFADVAPLLGLDDAGDGRSAARIDVDFDGDDDLVLTQRTAPRLRVLRGSLGDGALGLAVQVEGTRSNREGIGARVFAEPEWDVAEEARDWIHVRTRTAGSGYLAQSSAWLRFHFGPGGERRRAPRARLRVQWPGCSLEETEDFGSVRLGRSYVLREGAGTAQERPRPTPVQLPAGALAAPDPEAPLRLSLPVFTSVASLQVLDRDGREGRIFGLTPGGPRGLGRPSVVIVFDSTDERSLERLGDLAALDADRRAADIPALAIDLAASPVPGSTLPFAATLMAASGWTGEVVSGVGEARVILEEFFSWRIGAESAPPLPWSLVMDPEGRVAHLRTAGWESGQLADDLRLMLVKGVERAAQAAPFGGRWLDPPAEVDLAPLQTRLRTRGADAAARELGLARVQTSRLDPVEVALRLGLAQLRSQQYEGAVESFRKAIQVDGENIRARQGLAIALQTMGRLEDALVAWGEALELDPDSRTSLTNRALTAVALGSLDLAREDRERLAGQGEASAAAVQAIDQALQEAESTRKARPDDPNNAESGGASDGSR